MEGHRAFKNTFIFRSNTLEYLGEKKKKEKKNKAVCEFESIIERYHKSLLMPLMYMLQQFTKKRLYFLPSKLG